MDIFCKVCNIVVISVTLIGIGIIVASLIFKMFYSIRDFLYNRKEKVFMIQFIPSGFDDNNPTLRNRYVEIKHIKAKNSAEAIGKFMYGYRTECFPIILKVVMVAD